eukprot:TRINITY_DN1498_c0_g1_i1.p1 TRINITY_DN1498_c0_g1~~TRINITY_DN1498_c0_g1_i1.p1  ORF type:complete len:278 (+),score=98.47 TRINITY_DN1498_c0_g1_i1:47-880(+)
MTEIPISLNENELQPTLLIFPHLKNENNLDLYENCTLNINENTQVIKDYQNNEIAKAIQMDKPKKKQFILQIDYEKDGKPLRGYLVPVRQYYEAEKSKINIDSSISHLNKKINLQFDKVKTENLKVETEEDEFMRTVNDLDFEDARSDDEEFPEAYKDKEVEKDIDERIVIMDLKEGLTAEEQEESLETLRPEHPRPDVISANEVKKAPEISECSTLEEHVIHIFRDYLKVDLKEMKRLLTSRKVSFQNTDLKNVIIRVAKQKKKGGKFYLKDAYLN